MAAAAGQPIIPERYEKEITVVAWDTLQGGKLGLYQLLGILLRTLGTKMSQIRRLMAHCRLCWTWTQPGIYIVDRRVLRAQVLDIQKGQKLRVCTISMVETCLSSGITTSYLVRNSLAIPKPLEASYLLVPSRSSFGGVDGRVHRVHLDFSPFSSTSTLQPVLPSLLRKHFPWFQFLWLHF